MTDQEAMETARQWLEGNRLSVERNQRYLANMILTVDNNARKDSRAIPAETLDQAIERLELIRGLGHGQRGREHTCTYETYRGVEDGCPGCISISAEHALVALRAVKEGKP